jgi:glycosyltransferase involved in cell wall biosynthesis
MKSIRWFAPNRYCGLVVPALREAGWSIATEGDDSADLVVAMDGQSAVLGFEFARRHRCRLLLYLWDLPPWRLGGGRPDVVFECRGRIRRVPRILGGFRERAGYYSRISFAARRADWVWAPSTATVTDLASRFGVEARSVPFCYDSARFRPVGWEPVTPQRLLSISRLVPHKNHDAVIRAASRMEPRPVLHLIGQGPEAPALVRLAAELGVRLELAAEWQTDEAVADAYRRATVVVAPSRFEGFGLTPIEGVATGVPTVASDIPPHREHLGNAVHYFNLEDELSLVAAIRIAIELGPVDPAAVAHLTIERAAARFATHLAELVGS